MGPTMRSILDDLLASSLTVRLDGDRLLIGGTVSDSQRSAIRDNKAELVQGLVESAKALESKLDAIKADIRQFAVKDEITASAGRLLQDCRDLHSEGSIDRAHALADRLAVTIPEYVRNL